MNRNHLHRHTVYLLTVTQNMVIHRITFYNGGSCWALCLSSTSIFLTQALPLRDKFSEKKKSQKSGFISSSHQQPYCKLLLLLGYDSHALLYVSPTHTSNCLYFTALWVWSAHVSLVSPQLSALMLAALLAGWRAAVMLC